jgi:hypothetical protein
MRLWQSKLNYSAQIIEAADDCRMNAFMHDQIPHQIIAGNA